MSENFSEEMNRIDDIDEEILPPVEESESERESFSDSVKIVSPMRLVMRRFFRSKLSMVGLCTMIVLLLFCFLGPIFVGWGEDEVDNSTGNFIITPMERTFTGADGETYTVYYVDQYQQQQNIFAPCFSSSTDANGKVRYHILGTDNKGMDVLTRLMCGGRVSLSLSLLVVVVNTLLGVLLGGVAGFFGKWVDMLIMRIVDIINCIPTLPILLIIGAILDAYSKVIPKESRIYILMAALTLISWTGVARLVRGQILYLREQEYMTAAEALGLPTGHKIFKHLVPNVMPQLIVSMTLDFATCMLTESTLSYLGFGIPLPTPTWGNLLNGANNSIVIQQYWWQWVFPAAIFGICTICINLIGDGLRDALDPKLKK